MEASTRSDDAKQPFELGLYSFAELTPDAHSGQMITPRQRMRDLLESIELADQVGLDVFGLGEHHRPDFISLAPAVILAAAAARTKRIRLSSAVSVISSDDPVRVFQRFATLDLISNGRAEIMAGRGSFIESFPAYEMVMNKIGRERGWAPLTRPQYEASATLHGANFIGSPDEIIEKILYQHTIFGHQRLLLQFTIGTMAHDKVMHAIELFGTKVAPVVRAEIGRRVAPG